MAIVASLLISVIYKNPKDKKKEEYVIFLRNIISSVTVLAQMVMLIIND